MVTTVTQTTNGRQFLNIAMFTPAQQDVLLKRYDATMLFLSAEEKETLEHLVKLQKAKSVAMNGDDINIVLSLTKEEKTTVEYYKTVQRAKDMLQRIKLDLHHFNQITADIRRSNH